MKRLTLSVLIAWFILVVLLGADGVFTSPAKSPPLPIFLGVTIPLLVFAGAYVTSHGFRQFVRSADLRLLTAIQGWRAGGLGFLALAAHGVLPYTFALPAGLGDIAIGITAPWILLGLLREPGSARRGRFVTWNFLGILDLVVAVSAGAISSGILPRLSGAVTTAPMAQLPLVLVPAYLVPMFIMLHISALLTVRSERAIGANADLTPRPFAGAVTSVTA